MNKIVEKTREIYNILLKKGRSSTSFLAHKANCIQYKAEDILEDLESQGFVRKFNETNATYWEVTDEQREYEEPLQLTA